MPGGGKRAGLGLAVTHHAGDDEVGIVESRAIGMHQRIAEFTALVDRAGRFGSRMARNAAGTGELPEEFFAARLDLPDIRVNLLIGALTIGIGHTTPPALDRAAEKRKNAVQVK